MLDWGHRVGNDFRNGHIVGINAVMMFTIEHTRFTLLLISINKVLMFKTSSSIANIDFEGRMLIENWKLTMGSRTSCHKAYYQALHCHYRSYAKVIYIWNFCKSIHIPISVRELTSKQFVLTTLLKHTFYQCVHIYYNGN